MNQLDDATRRALCAADQPPPGAEQRVLAAILQGGGPGGGGEGGGGPQLPMSGAESTLAYAAKVVGATLGLTAGGLALVAVTGAGIRSLRVPERAPVVAAEAVPTVDDAASELAQPEADAAIEPANERALALADQPRKRGNSAGGSAETATADGPSGAAGPTLEAELALIQQARAAPPEQALSMLERHRREFADGVLADEREVLRVETLCALGRAAEAESVAAAFLNARPQHPLRSRVESACESR